MKEETYKSKDKNLALCIGLLDDFSIHQAIDFARTYGYNFKDPNSNRTKAIEKRHKDKLWLICCVRDTKLILEDSHLMDDDYQCTWTEWEQLIILRSNNIPKFEIL